MCSSDLQLLSEGACIGIYPEGTRSPDGKLYKGRTGIARMALESGAPVIPVAMLNTAEIQPTGQVVPKVMQVEMRFGEPMTFSGDATDIQLLRSITDEIMNKIQELSGQEYVDIYASEAKLAIAKARREAVKNELSEKRAERKETKSRKRSPKKN